MTGLSKLWSEDALNAFKQKLVFDDLVRVSRLHEACREVAGFRWKEPSNGVIRIKKP